MSRRVSWMSALVFVASAGLAAVSTPQSKVTSQSKKVDFPDTVTLAGKTVPSGDHTVVWQGDRSNLDVKILDGKKLLAESRGQIQDSKTKHENDAVVTYQGSGTPVLTEIDFGGQTTTLVFKKS